MAKPIGTTTVLTGKEAAAFLTKIHRDSGKKVALTPTPKLERARALIRKHGSSR